MTEPDYASAAYVARARQDITEFFRHFAFTQLLGMELVEIDPGRATLSIAWRADLCQPAGILHGGVLASLVDTAIAHAILLTPQNLAAKDQGGALVSVDLRIKYLRPVSSGRVDCQATVTRMGRQIIHATAIVSDEGGKEVATGDSIYLMVAGERLKKKGG